MGIAFGRRGELLSVSYENSLSESSEGILDAIPARSGAMLPLRRRTPIYLSRESVPGSRLDPPPAIGGVSAGQKASFSFSRQMGKDVPSGDNTQDVGSPFRLDTKTRSSSHLRAFLGATPARSGAVSAISGIPTQFGPEHPAPEDHENIGSF